VRSLSAHHQLLLLAGADDLEFLDCGFERVSLVVAYTIPMKGAGEAAISITSEGTTFLRFAMLSMWGISPNLRAYSAPCRALPQDLAASNKARRARRCAEATSRCRG
jgi:hypothetical protein